MINLSSVNSIVDQLARNLTKNCQQTIWSQLITLINKSTTNSSVVAVFPFPINPLNLKSDQHQISPLQYLRFIKQSGEEN